MSIPDYQTLMASTLSAVGDGEQKTSAMVRNHVAQRLLISEGDRRERMRSGGLVFDNRVHWALTYLSQAGLDPTSQARCR